MVQDVIVFLDFAIAALLCVLAAVWIQRNGSADRADRRATVTALAITALWCVIVAAIGPDRPWAYFAEAARDFAWTFVVFRLFANDGRDESLRLVRPVIGALVFAQLLNVSVIFVAIGGVLDANETQVAFQTSSLLRILVAVGSLVLLHNLYAGASKMSRHLLAWSAGALTLFWGFELNLHTVAYLGGEPLARFSVLRGVAMGAVALGAAFGFARTDKELVFRPSRAVTFQLLSLVLIGAYLGAMVLLSGWASRFSGDLGRITQVGFLLGAAGFAVIWLPSEKLRGWARVMAAKHFFKHRYDYRNEWIRFTQTIGRQTGSERSLSERAIKSLADITDSPSGLLLMPDDDGSLALAASWQWPQPSVPGPAMPNELARIMERHEIVLDLDESRKGISHQGEADLVPDWLLDEPRAWAAAPLTHHGRLVGVVVLGRPAIARRLDWEDFDLLGVAGKQVASYLAEQSGQKALEEASRFDEFNRRMAFVMHDIKNLSSQMSLLLSNAERHADNPEFRKDMLVTLRSSADKLNALLARLGRYGSGAASPREQVDLAEVGRALKARFRHGHEIRFAEQNGCSVQADRDGLEQALAHFVQNALDASVDGQPIAIAVENHGLRASITIRDSGNGMSAQFIRNELFRPFVSTKDGGFGIGAHEARVMIQAMGGRLDVESAPGLGSSFVVSFPTVASEKLRASKKDRSCNPESEVA